MFRNISQRALYKGHPRARADPHKGLAVRLFQDRVFWHACFKGFDFAQAELSKGPVGALRS